MGGAAALAAVPSVIRAAEGPAGCAVDFGARLGRPVKALNGVNLGPLVTDAEARQEAEDFKRLNVSLVRLHDAPHQNTGANIVDVQLIFPVWAPKADPRDPSFYFFRTTDDYIRTIFENSHAEVAYRLGTSIECGPAEFHYFAKEPKDHARYAEICAGIVRHYTQGWAGGFKWPVNYWEIWNEPDGVPPNWDQKDFHSYVSFYVDVAKRLRQEFPAIKIGGPALSWFSRKNHHAEAEMLVKACREQGAPLDFFSWHWYAQRPGQLTEDCAAVRQLLDSNGFRSAETWMDEWHYLPCGGFEPLFRPGGRKRWVDAPDGLNGIDSAAFTAACLTAWQDIPLDRSCYYASALRNYGFRDYYGELRPNYYALRMFGDFMLGRPERVRTQGADSVFLLGGVGADGRKCLLATCFKPARPFGLSIRLSGVSPSGRAEVERLDGARPPEARAVAYDGGVLTLPDVAGSSVFLVRF